jgi:hypothetical protein
LQPFVAKLLDRRTVCGEVTIAPAVAERLRQASAATPGRLLAPARARYPARGATITRPGTWLKHEIPIRTFAEWDDVRPGFLEIDLVAHGGSSTEGCSLCTLCLEAVWSKRQEPGGGAGPARARPAAAAPARAGQRQRAEARRHQELVRKTRDGARTRRYYRHRPDPVSPPLHLRAGTGRRFAFGQRAR